MNINNLKPIVVKTFFIKSYNVVLCSSRYECIIGMDLGLIPGIVVG